MKYFLKNIAQKSLMRTIFLVLIGLLFCIISLLGNNGLPQWGVLGLVFLNSFIAMQCAYKVGWTNLPSGFVLSSVWIVLLALLMWNIGWQIHLVAMIFMLAVLILNKIDIQEEATEQAYILTLMCLVLLPHLVVMVVGVLYVLGALLTRSHFTWRVLVAILLAIATYALYSAILRYFGWLDFLWLENLPRIPWHRWAIGGVAYSLVWLMLYLPIKEPSVWSGAIYIISVAVAIAASILRIIF